MSYKPVISGGVVVEVSKEEYEKLIRDSEKVATLQRFMDEQGYITMTDIANILGIERKEK